MVGITEPPRSRHYEIQSIVSGKACRQVAPEHSSERMWQLLTCIPGDQKHRDGKAKRNSVSIKVCLSFLQLGLTS